MHQWQHLSSCFLHRVRNRAHQPRTTMDEGAGRISRGLRKMKRTMRMRKKKRKRRMLLIDTKEVEMGATIMPTTTIITILVVAIISSATTRITVSDRGSQLRIQSSNRDRSTKSRCNYGTKPENARSNTLSKTRNTIR